MNYKKYLMGIFLPIITFLSLQVTFGQSVPPSQALATYVALADSTYRWELYDSSENDKLTYYHLVLTSQTWRDITWQHQLTLVVPAEVNTHSALLYIAGGAVDEAGFPKMNMNLGDRHLQTASTIAAAQKIPVAVLRQVPNQPLFGGKKEDELISMTLHRYQQDQDYAWPLLFPMVKSALRAMDATQDFLQQLSDTKHVNTFVVTGLSKRGWTTWLTAAVDRRVIAIAPMVIDVLNMPVSLQYQIDTWGDYSPEIQDYVALGIPQQARSEKGKEIIAMVDPYSYRKLLTMPKMLFMGTNDPYWVLDNVKHYLDGIPGENRLHYVPNAGHDLGDGLQATQALSAFVGQVTAGTHLPRTSWHIESKDGTATLSIDTSPDQLEDVVLWTALSDTNDFRKANWQSIRWTKAATAQQTLSLQLPASGYKAHYVDLIYRTSRGESYSQSTRIFLFDQQGLL